MSKVISDYDGYDYKKEFWENVDREYEDQADRMAIRKLLPKRMNKFADIGGGYGRLANEYLKRAHTVIIFDYSKSELEQAKETYGDKIETRSGDIYKLPFKDAELDGTNAHSPKWHVTLPAAPKSIPSIKKSPTTKKSPPTVFITTTRNTSKTSSLKPVSIPNVFFPSLISAARASKKSSVPKTSSKWKMVLKNFSPPSVSPLLSITSCVNPPNKI